MGKESTADLGKDSNPIVITVGGNEKTIAHTFKNMIQGAKAESIGNQFIQIKAASLKGDFCYYTYEFEVQYKSGLTSSDKINRQGSLIIHDDMRKCFNRLNAHLAVICEEIPSEDISGIEGLSPYDDEIHRKGGIEHKVSHFYVSSFSISGIGENESVVLSGSKRLSTGDYVELKSPKTAWDGNYIFINELRVAIDDLKNEVELYMNGKSQPQLVQSKMDFDKAANEFGEQDR